MGWMKGRKQSLQEEITEIIDEYKIEYDSNLLYKSLNKMNEKELDQLRYIVVKMNRINNQ